MTTHACSTLSIARQAALPALVGLILSLGCCAPTSQTETLQPAPFDALPGWSGSDQSAAFAQFRRQCERIGTMAADEALGGSGLAATLAGTAKGEQPACLAARNVTATDGDTARRFFERWFSPYRADDLELAGYFEPEIVGSTVETPVFRTPVYQRPSDLVTVRATDGPGLVSGRASNGVVVPYDTREAIDHGALRGRATVLGWLRDPVDLYLLQKEGAGRIRLVDGGELRLAYAGQNGARPAPIADRLVARGMLRPDDTGPAAIRAALERYSGEVGTLIEADPSYVFFRVLPPSAPEQGPPGTLGVSLAALHSLSVDRLAIPLGVPVFLATEEGAPLRTLALAEDEGGDVAAPDRADLFFGAGEAAGQRSRDTHARAEAFLLLPRPVRPAVP